MNYITRFYLILFLLSSSCKFIIGDCTSWGDIASKSYENSIRLYQLDSLSYINLSPFLNNKLEEDIIESNRFTWFIDSIIKVEGNQNLASFFIKNQLKGGSVFNTNTVYFYFSSDNNIAVYDDCNTLRYTLVYLKDDKAPIYSGSRKYLNDRIKWFRIAAHWYLLARVR